MGENLKREEKLGERESKVREGMGGFFFCSVSFLLLVYVVTLSPPSKKFVFEN